MAVMWTEPTDPADRWTYGPNDGSGLIVAEIRTDGTDYLPARVHRYASPDLLGTFATIGEAKAAAEAAVA